MKTTVWLPIFVSLLIFSACTGSGYEPSVNGDYSEVKLKIFNILKGELVAVTDSFVYMEIDKKIIAVAKNKLNEVFIDKYTDRSWLFGVVLLEALPAVVLSGIASRYTNTNFFTVFAVSIIPAVISTILYEVSTPKSTYDDFKDKSSLEELKKFSRFPGGISGEQLKEYLKSYGQDSCIYVK